MKRLVLLILLMNAAEADASAADIKASTETVALAELFLKTPTPRLPPDRVEDFLKIAPESLPRRLRLGYRAKRLELYNLKQMAEGDKKSSIRYPGADCSPQPGSKSIDLKTLRFGQAQGFWEEIKEEEEDYLLKKTNCTELELMCEFSLQIALETNPKTKKTRRHYFLNPNDPLMVFVGEYRAGGKGGNTPFFGRGGGPVCSH